jgi:hypothetical protein
MSSERLVGALGRQLARRNFLVKLGMGAVGAVAGAVGLPLTAMACINSTCCCLCLHDIWPNVCSGCSCTWCWGCCDTGRGGVVVQCCECYSAGYSCAGGCGGVYCSYSRDLTGPGGC